MTDEVHLQRGRLATFLRPIWEPLVSDHIDRYYDYRDEIWAWKADGFTCLSPDFRPNKVTFPMYDGRIDIEKIAAQHVTTHGEWAKRVGKKTRNMVRKAEKTLAWWPWEGRRCASSHSWISRQNARNVGR